MYMIYITVYSAHSNALLLVVLLLLVCCLLLNFADVFATLPIKPSLHNIVQGARVEESLSSSRYYGPGAKGPERSHMKLI
jgi:hypothetical protein